MERATTGVSCAACGVAAGGGWEDEGTTPPLVTSNDGSLGVCEVRGAGTGEEENARLPSEEDSPSKSSS